MRPAHRWTVRLGILSLCLAQGTWSPAQQPVTPPVEIPPPSGGQVVRLPLPPLDRGDIRFPINLAAALRLSDARPMTVRLAQSATWRAEADLQKAQVLWIPTMNLGFDYIRHDGLGPDLNNGQNVPQGINALGQPDPGSFGKPSNQNISVFYGGTGFTFTPEQTNYFVQPVPGTPMLPQPEEQYLTDIIFEPLRNRQNLNSKRWAIQRAKNDALRTTARTYFNVHRFRGQYAGAMDVVEKGHRLVDTIAALSKDLVSGVEVERARSLLADLEQQAASARQYWRRSSAELSQVLRLDPRVVVEPLEPDHLQITLIDPSRPLDELVPIALTRRPELESHQATVQATLIAIRREKLRPLTPGVLLNGFTTPYELIEAGAYGEGKGTNLNEWSARDDITPQLSWQAKSMWMGNLALIKEQRSLTSQAIVELFRLQDAVAADVARCQADLQSAAVRVVEAERGLRSAIVTYNGNVEGLKQTKRFGDVLVQIFRPQEVVYALQLLKTAYDHYYATVADYNQAQFDLFHALGNPAQELSQQKPPGEAVPVDTERPGFLPEVRTGPPPATR